MASAIPSTSGKIPTPNPNPLPPKLQKDLSTTWTDVTKTGKTVAKLGNDLFTGKNPAADAKTLGANIQSLQVDKTNLQNDLKTLGANSPLRQDLQNFLTDSGKTITAGQKFLKSPTAQNWQTLMQDGQKLPSDIQKIVGGTGLGNSAVQTAKDLQATGTTVGKLANDLWTGASPTADATTLGKNIQALQGDIRNFQQYLPQLPANSPLRQDVQNFLTDGGKTITAGQQFVKDLGNPSQIYPSPATRDWQAFLADGGKLLPDIQKIIGDIHPNNGSVPA